MVHPVVLALGSAVLLACASPRVAVAQDAAGCDSLRAVARQAPDSWFTAPPKPSHMVLPPSRWPKDFLTADVLVTVLVDPSGRPVADSTLVTGTADSGYIRKLHRTFEQFRFNPATRGSCTVPGHYQQTIRFQH